jgi:phosphoglycerate dehydrogenase-like enzyme
VVSGGFLSVELIGLSSKGSLSPELAAFFASLQRAPNLRWLHVCSSGADRPDYAKLMARGVRVTTSAGANAVAVAHSALTGVMALGRGLPRSLAAQRRREWLPLRFELSPRDLPGQRAVVVGLGRIGLEIARLLKSLGLRVTGVRKRAGEPAAHCDAVHPFSEFRRCLPEADWLVLACPLTPETRSMVDAAALAAMPAGARLVNVARGEVVVEKDLVAALRSGHLESAYLDVFENEPLPVDSPLWDMDQVFITAHSAGNSTGFAGRVNDLFLDNLGRWTRGEALVNEVSG